MKLRITLKRSDAQQLRFKIGNHNIRLNDDTETKRFDAELKTASGTPWTCEALFDDIAQTDLARSLRLKEWELRRGQEKWRGYANEKSLNIHDGDEITLVCGKGQINAINET
jgi:hypothetical protein